jgi:hypothetical protein
LKYIISMRRKHGLIIGGKLLTMYLSWLICILLPCVIRYVSALIVSNTMCMIYIQFRVKSLHDELIYSVYNVLAEDKIMFWNWRAWEKCGILCFIIQVSSQGKLLCKGISPLTCPRYVISHNLFSVYF